jgi:hypothetical protein
MVRRKWGRSAFENGVIDVERRRCRVGEGLARPQVVNTKIQAAGGLVKAGSS